MIDRERFKLRFGPYETPEFSCGAKANDFTRGLVVIVELSAARIPWPIGKRGPGKSPVLFGALASAVRCESKQAVAHWFGVSLWRVQQWRNALAVRSVNEGTSQVLSASTAEPRFDEHRAKADAKARDPERRA